MKNIYVIGDTHTLNFTYHLKEANLKDFILVGLGDHGEGFQSPEVDKRSISKLQEYCEQNNGELLILRGNHSNPAWFVENSEFNTELVKFLPDYTIKEFENGEEKVKCLFVGGALSIDRQLRTEGKDYWSGEEFNLIENYKDLEKCDIVFAHTVPNEAFYDNFANIQYYLDRDSKLKDDLINERNRVSELFNHLKPTVWCHGHFHRHYVNFWKGDFNCAFRGLKINEIMKVI